MTYHSQAGQDTFANNILKGKTNGFFVELGSNHWRNVNNTIYFEQLLNWKGIMIEYDRTHLSDYKKFRKNSIHIIEDATNIDYLSLFGRYNVPNDIDYLSFDLEADNRSTLTTLELLDKKTVLDNYKFATITFETDIYRGNYYNTRDISRKIFQKHGYVLVFPDVQVFYKNKLCPFEDWWVHPDLVDMSYVNKLKTDKSLLGSNIDYNFDCSAPQP
tara:strand:+ start:185 stop:832 length:648 start_codon:yes stop_codon:yes gene_type:complete